MDQEKKPAARKKATAMRVPTLVKFKTGYCDGQIESVKVLRETVASVYLPPRRHAAGAGELERREAKVSDWTQYHDTWADAHAYLMKKAEGEVESIRLRLEQAKGWLGNIKGMKPPQEGA